MSIAAVRAAEAGSRWDVPEASAGPPRPAGRGKAARRHWRPPPPLRCRRTRCPRMGACSVWWHRLRSAPIGLALAAVSASNFVGERSDVLIIEVIIQLSVGLGVANEYRAQNFMRGPRRQT
jgi:P-type Mg2+ transporter